MERLKPTLNVITSDGRRGVTVPDFMSCCTPDETPVVFDGEIGFVGTPTTELRVLGPENAVPEPTKCGAGQGAKCCIYMTVGAKGFCCERHTEMRYHFIFNRSKMNAKRSPVKAFPDCQDLTDNDGEEI